VQKRWIWWCVQKNGNTCGPDVDWFSVAGIFEDFGGDVAERAGAGGGLLVKGVEAFWAVEDEHRNGEWTGDVHAKVEDNNVTVRVRGAVEDVLGSATSAKGERKAHSRSRWTMSQRWR